MFEIFESNAALSFVRSEHFTTSAAKRSYWFKKRESLEPYQNPFILFVQDWMFNWKCPWRSNWKFSCEQTSQIFIHCYTLYLSWSWVGDPMFMCFLVLLIFLDLVLFMVLFPCFLCVHIPHLVSLAFMCV